MTKHTPGPWVIEYDTCDCGGEYPCGHNPYPYQLLAPARQVERYPTLYPDKTFPAIIANFTEGDAWDKEADARLIAAAPDLLAACQDALAVFDRYIHSATEDAAGIERIRAAIAKAVQS